MICANASGTCGDDLTWTYDNGTLTISGTGKMDDNYGALGYDYGTTPWDSYHTSITNIIIGDGVTYIGAYAFYNLTALRSVTIPGNVTLIGDDAFECSGLETVTLMNGITELGYGAFRNCKNLTTINFPDSVTTICKSAFYGCSCLRDVTLHDNIDDIGPFAFCDCVSLIANF